MYEDGRRRAALFGAAFAALVTLPGLGIGTLWDNSETAYGEVAREVLLFHDPVLLHFNGAPWFVQPPLYFWVAALCVKLFGLGSFALRLPSALATIAMGAAAASVVARAAGVRAGILASLVLSSSLMQAVLGRLAVMDALLDLAVLAAILAWWKALSPGVDPRIRDRAVLIGSVAAALGVLDKGPVALVIPAIVLLPWFVWQKRAGGVAFPGRFAIVASAAVFLAISVPWPVCLAKTAGGGALLELVGHYSFGRFVGTIENQSGPFYYYVPVVVLGFCPWVAFLFPAARAAFDRTHAPQGSLERLTLCWAVTPFLFFSIAQTKLPNYIALELPALAILVGLWFDQIAAGAKRAGALAAAAAVPLTIGVIAIAMVVFSHDNRLAVPPQLAHDIELFGVIGLLGSALAFGCLLREPAAAYAAPVLGAASAVCVLAGAFVALPHADALKPIPPLAAVINRERRDGDMVAIQSASGENALIFYTAPPVVALDGNARTGRRSDRSAAHDLAPRGGHSS